METKKRKISNEFEVESKRKTVTVNTVRFNRSLIPLPVIRLILSYMMSNYHLLNNFGMVNKTVYQLSRLNWKAVVKVTEKNVDKIPEVVLKGLERLWFFSRVAFKKVDFVRIISNINPTKLKFLSFEASQVTKSSSRNEFYLLVIKKLKIIFPNCEHLTVCYGVREDTAFIKWDFLTAFPNIKTIESPAMLTSSMISQLPNIERILHGMKRDEVLKFLEMMESEHKEKCNQIKYFHKKCERETQTAFEVGRYGRESPYKQAWGNRQLKEPESFPPCLEKTVEVFKNLERVDLSYSKRLTVWEKEGIQGGNKMEYKIDVLCISRLTKLKILNFSVEYDGDVILCDVKFPHNLRTVKSMKLTTIPYNLFLDHISPQIKHGMWNSLKSLEISLSRKGHVGFFDYVSDTDEMTGEKILIPSKLTENGRRHLDELITKNNFPTSLEYMKIAFSSRLALEFSRITDRRMKDVKILLFGWVWVGKHDEDQLIFKQVTMGQNLKDESIQRVSLEMDSVLSSVLEEIPSFVVVFQRK